MSGEVHAASENSAVGAACQARLEAFRDDAFPGRRTSNSRRVRVPSLQRAVSVYAGLLDRKVQVCIAT